MNCMALIGNRYSVQDQRCFKVFFQAVKRIPVKISVQVVKKKTILLRYNYDLLYQRRTILRWSLYIFPIY